MYPILLTIGNISISSFGFMIVVAFLSANYILKKDFIRYGYDPDFADDIIFRAALGGILGAKLYYLIENAGNGAYENIYGIVNPPPVPETPTGILTSGFIAIYSSATACVIGNTVDDPSISIVDDVETAPPELSSLEHPAILIKLNIDKVATSLKNLRPKKCFDIIRPYSNISFSMSENYVIKNIFHQTSITISQPTFLVNPFI